MCNFKKETIRNFMSFPEFGVMFEYKVTFIYFSNLLD